jgi:hypothetical protein
VEDEILNRSFVVASGVQVDDRAIGQFNDLRATKNQVSDRPTVTLGDESTVAGLGGTKRDASSRTLRHVRR